MELLDLLQTAVRERLAEKLDRRAATDAAGRLATYHERERLVYSLPGDLRHAWRQVRRAPGFHAAVILTLALGIGLNTAVFSGVHALLFRQPAGIADADNLVEIYRTWPEIPHGPSSIPHYRDMRDRSDAIFDGVAAWSFVDLSVSAGGDSEVMVGQMVSANFFDVLGTQVAIGRAFAPDEGDGPGVHPVVVLSYDTWRTRFGRDPSILGRTLSINGATFEVIGVASEGFRGVRDVYAPALWAPLSMQPVLQPGQEYRLENRNSNFLAVIARLGPGQTIESARAGALALFEGLKREHPDVYEGTGLRVVAGPGAGAPPGWGSRPADLATLLVAVVALLLVLACANVGNMLLSRAEQRRREIAIRIGIGAGRARIVRQLLSESLLFAALAGVAGLVLAHVALRAMDGVRLPGQLPLDVQLELSMPVLAYTMAVALVTPFVFGLVPALRASRSARTGEIGRTASGAFRPSRTMSALVVVQTALAVVLLLSAALFLRSLVAATRVETGFEADGLITARAHPGLAGLDRAAAEGFTRTLAGRLEADPAVSSVSWSDVLPLSDTDQSTRIAVAGYVPPPDEQMSVGYTRVGPRWFETMGIPLLSGRGIMEGDDAASEPVLVINRAMADRYWPGEDPIGRIVAVQDAERRIVGIVPTGKYRTLADAYVPFMYVAFAQDYRADITLIVRYREEAAAVPALLAVARETDAMVPVRDIRSMRSRMGVLLLSSRIAAATLGLFGVLGLLLSTIGTYAVIAHGVSRRTREIGIRMALGARPVGVLREVLANAAGLSVAGTAAGVLVAVVVAVLVRRLLHTPQAVDPWMFATVALGMLLVALLAAAIPARRASRIDPVRALRSD
jgi:predicted permease